MRCYDGCPDTEYQKYLDSIQAAKDNLKKVIPRASCTYFPNGEFYQVFVNYRAITKEHKSIFSAVAEALEWAKQ